MIRHKAPLVGFANSITICSLVDRALERAGTASAYRGWVLRRNAAEKQYKGHESSKSDQKYLFSPHLGLIRNLFTLSESKSAHVS